MSNNVTVKHKDNVFCLLYNDKKNLLDLYNALNNSSYTEDHNDPRTQTSECYNH